MEKVDLNNIIIKIMKKLFSGCHVKLKKKKKMTNLLITKLGIL
jgi:hypothetical protein